MYKPRKQAQPEREAQTLHSSTWRHSAAAPLTINNRQKLHLSTGLRTTEIITPSLKHFRNSCCPATHTAHTRNLASITTTQCPSTAYPLLSPIYILL